MSLKRILGSVCIPLLLSSLCFSQNLAELAKKERERREKLKGKKSILVTNADLLRLRKSPAVSVSQTVTEPEKSRRTLPPRKKTRQRETPSREFEEADKMEFGAPQKNIEAKLKNAKELADLLALRMNALWQEYHSKSDRRVKERIRTRIYQTSQKLAKARKDEKEARKELQQLRMKNDS